jgi:hypothetical protein
MHHISKSEWHTKDKEKIAGKGYRAGPYGYMRHIVRGNMIRRWTWMGTTVVCVLAVRSCPGNVARSWTVVTTVSHRQETKESKQMGDVG